MKLPRHTDDHVIKVGVEILSFRHIDSEGRFKVVSCHNVVDVVDGSRPESNLGEVSGPGSSVSVLGLVLRIVSSVHVIVDVSISVVPLLVIVLFEMLMGWVNSKVLCHPC